MQINLSTCLLEDLGSRRLGLVAGMSILVDVGAPTPLGYSAVSAGELHPDRIVVTEDDDPAHPGIPLLAHKEVPIARLLN